MNINSNKLPVIDECDNHNECIICIQPQKNITPHIFNKYYIGSCDPNYAIFFIEENNNSETKIVGFNTDNCLVEF